MDNTEGNVTSLPTSVQWLEQTSAQNTTTTTNTSTSITTNISTTTSTDITSIEDFPGQFYVQYVISDALLTSVPPLLLLLGTFGNVMTMLVMRALTGGRRRRRSPLGDPSMGVYFPCLALSDQMVLTVGLGRKWVKALALYDIRTLHDAICKLHKFLVFAGSRTSTWILVAVTSQRALTVTWPLRQREASTRKRAVGVVAGIVAACCALDSGIFLLYSLVQTTAPGEGGRGHTQCRAVGSGGGRELAFFQVVVYPWVRIVSGSLLPLLLLVLNNAVLACGVTKAARAMRSVKHRHPQATPTPTSSSSSSSSTSSSSLSLTLIVTSVAFVVLTSPISADFVIKYNLPWLWSREDLQADVHLADTVLDLLCYSNSAVNFYLYFLTGPTFRREAQSLLCAGKKSSRDLSKNSNMRKETSSVGNPAITMS